MGSVMLDIGIDFGSTYTTLSVYRRELHAAQAKNITNGASPAIPTVLARRPMGIEIGATAKSTVGTGRGFRLFKMMLVEDREKLLIERGFDKKNNSPGQITKAFLETLLAKILEHEDDKTIGHLFICAPEAWNEDIRTVDGKTRLRDICRELQYTDPRDKKKKVPYFPTQARKEAAVQVVSEPVAASAYFAQCFKEKRKRSFKGQLLLIDYGGGTLDITVTDVAPRQNGKSECVEIRVLERAGMGENNEETCQIGKAGAVYMESLTRMALETALGHVSIPYDEKFNSAVNQVEEALLNNKLMIDDVFSELGTDPRFLTKERICEAFATECEEFGDVSILSSVNYDGHTNIPITYQMLAQVYDDVIREPFQQKLLEIIEKMDAAGIDWRDRNSDRFKIVVVGGFGNFSLVENQVMECFGQGSADKRWSDMFVNRSDCQLAIANGAALLAADVIRVRNTAPFSIGVATKVEIRNEYLFTMAYGLKKGMDIELNREYYQEHAPGSPDVVAISAIRDFMLDQGRGPVKRTLKEEVFTRLKENISGGYVVFGFSLDASGVISLYIHEYDFMNKIIKPCAGIELDNISKLFVENVSVTDEDLKILAKSVNQFAKNHK